MTINKYTGVWSGIIVSGINLYVHIRVPLVSQIQKKKLRSSKFFYPFFLRCTLASHIIGNFMHVHLFKHKPNYLVMHNANLMGFFFLSFFNKNYLASYFFFWISFVCKKKLFLICSAVSECTDCLPFEIKFIRFG